MEQPSKKALVKFLGCKVNQAEAASISLMLADAGYQVLRDCRDPQIIVINTCAVTSSAEGKSRRLISRLAKECPLARIVVTGCMVEATNPLDGKVSADTVFLGTFEKDNFIQFLGGLMEIPSRSLIRRGSMSCSTFGDLGPAVIEWRNRAFLKIQDGCSQGCSYCVVPLTRGPSRSLPLDGLFSSAVQMTRMGCAEIVLTGIHLGRYGRDLMPRVTLEQAIEKLTEKRYGVRFRLSSIEPQELTPKLIELAAGSSSICRHFHIPVQSGDDKVLKRMGRPYNSELVHDLISRILETIPDACIGMDIMVGFPGEDQYAFENTLKLVQKLPPAYLHVFPFSPRPGTPAATFVPRVPPEESDKRVKILRQLSVKFRKSYFERFIGRTFEAVAETDPDMSNGTVMCRTDNYVPVLAKLGDNPNLTGVFRITIEGTAEDYALGSVVDA
jgi:threonylcarbamoyladenosine tRNA methylthiotransferase MtaB